MTVTIYHNPRCSKSRQTLELIQQKDQPIKIIEYLTADLSEQELKTIIKLLNLSDVREIMRTGDSIHNELSLADESLTQDQLIKIIIDNPALLQRPIVVAGNKAVIGRPPENVLEIL